MAQHEGSEKMAMGRNGIHHRLVALGLSVALACAAIPVMAQDGEVPPSVSPKVTRTPFLGGFLRETRVVYPLRVGPWKATDEKRYEPQEFGASVRYVHDEATDRWLDMYFYPAGVLTGEKFARMAEGERVAIVQARAQDGDPVPDVGPLQTFDIQADPDTDKVRGYSVDMSIEHGGATYTSAMTLSLDRLYFVKTRLSAAAGQMSRHEVREMAEAFMTDVMPGVRIISSGDCWMPLPIVQLGINEPPPAATISSSSGGEPPTEFLLADRVVAHDPESPGAQALMMLGMAQMERLFPGCASAEPTNPEVGEDEREMRLEYRAPPASENNVRAEAVELG